MKLVRVSFKYYPSYTQTDTDKIIEINSPHKFLSSNDDNSTITLELNKKTKEELIRVLGIKKFNHCYKDGIVQYYSKFIEVFEGCSYDDFQNFYDKKINELYKY